MPHTTFSNVARLYPNSAQRQLIRRSFGCRRFVYNKLLEMQKQRYQDYKDGKIEHGYIRYEEMCSILTILKSVPEYSWLREVNAQALQQTLRDLDKAFKRFFAGTAAYPTMKQRGRGDSFRSADWCAVSSDFRAVRLMKIGWVCCRGLRINKLTDSTGSSTFLSVQSITVKAIADYFESSVLFRVPAQAQATHQRLGSSCGIDVGIAKPIALAADDGDTATYGTLVQAKLLRHEKYVKKLQRKLARQVRGSKSHRRTKIKISKAHRHAANVRKDFNHQISNIIAKTYEVVVTEDLKLLHMTASAAGTVEEPGKNVKQKSGLNRELLRMASGQLNEFLAYKCKREGGDLLRVNPAYSSQECRRCGYIHPRNRESQAVFKCLNPDCGHTENADYNSAGVLRSRGLNIIKQRRELAQVEGQSVPAKPKPKDT